METARFADACLMPFTRMVRLMNALLRGHGAAERVYYHYAGPESRLFILAAQGRGLSFLFETRGSARRWTSELMLDPRLCRERVIFTKVWRGRELDESRRVLCTAAP